MKKVCQSCDMPLRKDLNHGETNNDGSKSEKYCYNNGIFTLSDGVTTAGEIQKMCIKQMQKQEMPHFLAWLMTRQIPQLEHWKSN